MFLHHLIIFSDCLWLEECGWLHMTTQGLILFSWFIIWPHRG